MEMCKSQGIVAAALLAMPSGYGNTNNTRSFLFGEHFPVFPVTNCHPRDRALCDLHPRRPPNNAAIIEESPDRKRGADLLEVRL